MDAAPVRGLRRGVDDPGSGRESSPRRCRCKSAAPGFQRQPPWL